MLKIQGKKAHSFSFGHSLRIIWESKCPFTFTDMQIKRQFFIIKEDKQQFFLTPASFIIGTFCKLLFVLHLLLPKDKIYEMS